MPRINKENHKYRFETKTHHSKRTYKKKQKTTYNYRAFNNQFVAYLNSDCEWHVFVCRALHFFARGAITVTNPRGERRINELTTAA